MKMKGTDPRRDFNNNDQSDTLNNLSQENDTQAKRIIELEATIKFNQGFAEGSLSSFRIEVEQLQAKVERLERVVEAGREWWLTKRPLGWDDDDHSQQPRVNCCTGAEEKLADTVAALEVYSGENT